MKRPHHYERKLIELVRSGAWSISEDGRVQRSGQRRTKDSRSTQRVDKLRSSGYRRVRACVDGVRVECGAHRLVWQHFFGDIPGDLEVNHKNGDPSDNTPSNLELTTQAENMLHSRAVLRKAQRIYTIAEVAPELLDSDQSAKHVAAQLGVSTKTVRRARLLRSGEYSRSTQVDNKYLIRKTANQIGVAAE